MSDCIHVRKTGYQNFRKQLKSSFQNSRLLYTFGTEVSEKIRLGFSRTVAVFSVSVTLVCRNLLVFYTLSVLEKRKNYRSVKIKGVEVRRDYYWCYASFVDV